MVVEEVKRSLSAAIQPFRVVVEAEAILTTVAGLVFWAELDGRRGAGNHRQAAADGALLVRVFAELPERDHRVVAADEVQIRKEGATRIGDDFLPSELVDQLTR